MTDELKYPILYGIMPIYEQIGWTCGLHELEREYDIVAYIVSKCYVVSERIEYKRDGSYKKSYEVVFVFQNSGQFDELERKIPEYNFYGQCNNSLVIDELFDNYEKAVDKTNEMNDVLLHKLLARCSLNNYKIIREKNITFK